MDLYGALPLLKINVALLDGISIFGALNNENGRQI